MIGDRGVRGAAADRWGPSDYNSLQYIHLTNQRMRQEYIQLRPDLSYLLLWPQQSTETLPFL
jgi:hypothetical protein